MDNFTLWFIGCMVVAGTIGIVVVIGTLFKAAVSMDAQLDYNPTGEWGPTGYGKSFPIVQWPGEEWFLNIENSLAESREQYESLVGAIDGVNKVIDELESSAATYAELRTAHQDRQELIDELIFEFGD